MEKKILLISEDKQSTSRLLKSSPINVCQGLVLLELELDDGFPNAAGWKITMVGMGHNQNKKQGIHKIQKQSHD